MRGRKEKDLEPHVSSEERLGGAIRAWRRFRGMTVTDLAVQAGFGPNGRGYISKIEHQQIKRLGEEPLAAIAQALDLSPLDLRQGRLPDQQESQLPGKETLDDAIAGCKAWLKVYPQEGRRLDSARTYLKLAELYWARTKLAERREERGLFLVDALTHINKALPLFAEEAPGTYEEAQRLHATIQRELHRKDLDDAIAGCQALLQVSRQQEQPLDWARTHTRLAQLYWDRAGQAEQAEERHGWLGKALHSLDQALPLFREHAPVSYTQAQRLRSDVEAAREAAF